MADWIPSSYYLLGHNLFPCWATGQNSWFILDLCPDLNKCRTSFAREYSELRNEILDFFSLLNTNVE